MSEVDGSSHRHCIILYAKEFRSGLRVQGPAGMIY